MRGKRAKKREVKPDSRYNSALVSKFINYLMLDGKKSVAENVVYTALEGLEVEKKADEAGKKIKLQGVEVMEEAIENVKPKLEIRSRRIGGANYQVPVPVNPDRQIALAMKWIINATRDSRKKEPVAMVLRRELLAAYNNEGVAIKKKEDTQKMAEANKAFAQFA